MCGLGVRLVDSFWQAKGLSLVSEEQVYGIFSISLEVSVWTCTGCTVVSAISSHPLQSA
jgi:hypothetical protein